MWLKVEKRKSPPFLIAVANGNKSGIIATAALSSIILAKNIGIFTHKTKKKQKKRKKILNIFTKTCTNFLNGVAQNCKINWCLR